jgi:hypothetical protein
LKRYSRNHGSFRSGCRCWCGTPAVKGDDEALIVPGDGSVGAGINEDEGGGRVMLWSVVIVYVTLTIEHGHP